MRPKVFDPDWRVHPGGTVLELINDYHLTQRIAARALGVTPSYLNDIILERRGISRPFAIRLTAVFGPSEEFWMRMQSNYDAPLPSERANIKRQTTRSKAMDL